MILEKELLKKLLHRIKLNKRRYKGQRLTGIPKEEEAVVLQEVFESVEEMERRNVEKPEKPLKGSKKGLKKKTPEKLRVKRRRRISKKRQLRQLITMLGIFLFAAFVAVFLMHEHYVKYPGILERDTVRLIGRGNDYIAIKWEPPRNVEEYEVYYKEYVREMNPGADFTEEEVPSIDDSWEKRTTTGSDMQITGLK